MLQKILNQTLKMIQGFAVLFAASLSSFSSVAQGSDFPSQVANEVQTPTVLTSDQMAEVESYQYIMVDGTLGEVWQTNFLPAQQFLTNNWPAAESVIIRPHSPNTIPDNADILYQQISDLRKASTKQKAIILAHSKGATEILLMALQHPEMSDQLGIVSYGLIAGPYGGTDVIDYVEKSCAKPNPACDFINWVLPSLETFTPSVIKPIYTHALLQLSDDDRQALEPKIFYVEAQMEDSDMTSSLYATHLYLNWAHPEEGPNDGLIPTANERLFDVDANGQSTDQVFGTDLGTIIGDHNSMTNGTNLKTTLLYKEAFFRALVERIVFGNNSGRMTLGE